KRDVMSSQIASELAGANPGPAAHLALLGGIVVIGLVIFGLSRWHKRREGQAEEELPTGGVSVTSEPRRPEAAHRPGRRTDPTDGTGEAVHDERKGGAA